MIKIYSDIFFFISGGCSSHNSVVSAIQSPDFAKLRHIGPPSNLLAPNKVNASSKQPKLTSVLKVKLHLFFAMSIVNFNISQIREVEEPKVIISSNIIVENVAAPASPIIGMSSPRPRNRIRTNPWVSNSTLSLSPIKQTTAHPKLKRESP